ncbi:MAG: membrane protein insertion efficiency factor YidD [Anaerolineae bacterium]|nr:membrane protein insertion efficiency factor YidD [Anaerolineae bacterium]
MWCSPPEAGAPGSGTKPLPQRRHGCSIEPGFLLDRAHRRTWQIVSLPQRVILGILTFYKRFISPALPPSCRYTPTCSEYTYEAVARYGAIRGLWLGLQRISRCHPFHPGGYDPVPDDAFPRRHQVGGRTRHST